MKRLTHFVAGFLVCFLPILAWGKESDDKLRFGSPIVIEKGQTAGDVVCLGCSIQVRGNLNGDAAAIGGHIEIDGEVDGDVAALGGNLRLGPTAKVEGDAAAVGGTLDRDPHARVGGDVGNPFPQLGRLHLNGPPGLILLPLILGLPLNLLLALVAYLIAGKRRVEVIASAVGDRVGQALATGIGVWIVATVLLVASSRFGPATPAVASVISLCIFATLILGYTGISAGLGRRFRKGRFGLGAVILGVVALTVVQSVPVLGWVAFLVFLVLALGGTVLSGFGSSVDWLRGHFPGRAPVPPASPQIPS